MGTNTSNLQSTELQGQQMQFPSGSLGIMVNGGIPVSNPLYLDQLILPIGLRESYTFFNSMGMLQPRVWPLILTNYYFYSNASAMPSVDYCSDLSIWLLLDGMVYNSTNGSYGHESTSSPPSLSGSLGQVPYCRDSMPGEQVFPKP